MSYDDDTMAACFHCEKIIWLGLMEHEIRDSQPVHTACAKEIDDNE